MARIFISVNISMYQCADHYGMLITAYSNTACILSLSINKRAATDKKHILFSLS